MVFDTGGSSCDIDTQKDGNAHSSDYLWFLPTCSQTASTAKTCSMSLGTLATSRGTNFSLTDAEIDLINMGGTGTLIFGDQNSANTPIPATSATTVVEEIHVETITLAATVANTVYMISNRHALTVCAFCLFGIPWIGLPSFFNPLFGTFVFVVRLFFNFADHKNKRPKKQKEPTSNQHVFVFALVSDARTLTLFVFACVLLFVFAVGQRVYSHWHEHVCNGFGCSCERRYLSHSEW